MYSFIKHNDLIDAYQLLSAKLFTISRSYKQIPFARLVKKNNWELEVFI